MAATGPVIDDITAGPRSRSVDVSSISLARIGGPVAVCTMSGLLVGATPSARALLERMPMTIDPLPAALPQLFWRELSVTPLGEAMQWVSSTAERHRLGCTRYSLGAQHFLLLMQEISDKQRLLAQRLHRQRLEATGRLVAGIAHDVRNSLSAIVFNVEMLGEQELDGDGMQSLDAIRTATMTLRRTVDGLLDFARLGPPRETEVSLPEVMQRVVSLLRGTLRGSRHKVVAELDPHAPPVKANIITLEQVLVNLIVNAVEANPEGTTVRLISDRTTSEGEPFVRLRVVNDGAPIPIGVQPRLFEPFFTTKEQGTGLGLAVSREAMRDLGGELTFDPTPEGPAFVLLVPAARKAKE